LFHARAKHTHHHLLEHAQESLVMPTQHNVRSILKRLHTFFLLLKGCGVSLTCQQNPGHLILEIWNAASILLE
jgi:hypothetical protein